MLMWIAILILTMSAFIGLLVYLTGRIMQFAWLKRATKEKKVLRVLSAVCLLGLFAFVISELFDFVNAVVIILHLGIFWMLFDSAFSFIAWQKAKKKGIGKEEYKKAKKQAKKEGPYPCYYAGAVTMVFTFLYLLAGWYFAHHVYVTSYDIQTDKEVENLRIVQFADSHVGATFGADGFAKHMETVQSLNPDIVLLTGDFVDDDTSKEDMLACCEALGKIKSTYGVYFSFGNHDKGYYGAEYRGFSGQDVIDTLENNGVTVLEDEAIPIGDDYLLVGRLDKSEEQAGFGRASMEELLAGQNRDRFMIVLDHQPNDYAAEEASGVDLVLSGHTHGGQLFPVNEVGVLIGANDRTYGYEKRGNTNFIVTSGIADWAIKFKTGCIAEINVIEVHK